MDPNEVLRRLRAAVEEVEGGLLSDHGTPDPFGENDNLRELVESFRALDGWLSRGGFRPADWNRTP